MANYIDANYPGPRGVPLSELPRGLVPPPPYVLEEMAADKARHPLMNHDCEVSQLNYLTLFYYYENIQVVYRPTDKGPEVFAVGYDEVTAFIQHTPPEQLEEMRIEVPG